MVRSSLSFIAIALLLGCTSKQETELIQGYSEKVTYHKQLQKTEKTQLYQDNVTKVMLTATYLYTPNFENHDTRDEVFIVGLYSEGQTAGALNSDGNTLTLNGKIAKSVKALSPEDERLKALSFVTPWSNYYLVTFPHESSKKITLLFESTLYGKGELHFAKVAKYVLDKS
ncbi:hypothetical protein MN086_06640 [Sulfurovum sp. XGS-02]|uniref:hypothetical protein n=1 Tax=Sulfurovum sp. XGS-02 TaxID=2925411 RepID=UPI00206C8765|nr:hypothetical protein [Sulfurovum sp. XGS-02]UPT76728.1 hypothetical protein MN086_06640 [Sulfurovum sp. XGS-02]